MTKLKNKNVNLAVEIRSRSKIKKKEQKMFPKVVGVKLSRPDYKVTFVEKDPSGHVSSRNNRFTTRDLVDDKVISIPVSSRSSEKRF